MEPWLIPVLSLAVGVIGGAIGGYIGVRVNVAVLESRMSRVEADVVDLRRARHDHAQALTRHELDVSGLKRRAGMPE